MATGWEIIVGKELLKRLLPVVEGYIKSAVGDRISSKSLEHQSKRIAKELAASMADYAAELPGKYGPATAAAAADFLLCVERFSLSFALILDANMDYRVLAKKMMATIHDDFASGTRKKVLGDMCEGYCEQLVLSLLTMPEFHVQFMAKCLSALSDIATDTKIMVKLMTAGQ